MKARLLIALLVLCILLTAACSEQPTLQSVPDAGQWRIALQTLGYLLDGDWDRAIVEFQCANGLPQTGRMNIKTAGRLFGGHAKARPPLLGIVIGIDPGHQQKGNADREPVAPGSEETKKKVSSGTQGRFTQVPEYRVTLDVGLRLRELLIEQGATVVMTRDRHDIDISNRERAILFNQAQTDYALRLHCNGASDASIHGAFVILPATNPQKEACDRAGQLLIDAFCAKTGAKNRGLSVRADQTGFNWCERMVINIEMGYMTNEVEDRKLTSESYQTLMAQGLADGIIAYFAQ